MKIFKAYCFALLSVSFFGCSVTTKLQIRNNSYDKIEVLAIDSQYLLAEIHPGEKRSVIYNYHCLRMRIGRSDIWYYLIQPDPDYYSAKLFSTQLTASYDEKDGLCMVSRNSEKFCFKQQKCN